MYDFAKTPIGDHMLRKINRSNFIDFVNNFWMWQDVPELWAEAGKPNPFDDGDVSIAQFLSFNLGFKDAES